MSEQPTLPHSVIEIGDPVESAENKENRFFLTVTIKGVNWQSAFGFSIQALF